jgi:hypothetical protein
MQAVVLKLCYNQLGDNMKWSTYLQRIFPYIVSIETPDGSGTGFLFIYNKTKTIAGFATAAHVVDHADEWKEPIKLVHSITKKELFVTDEKRVIFLDLPRDSASIMLFDDFNIGLPRDTLPLIEANKTLRIGAEVGWLGFPSIAYPNLCFFTGRISARLDKYDSYLIDGVAINGVSGGPVIHIPTGTSSPRIIGTVTRYMPNRIYGDTLPGLLRVQDVTSFHNTIEALKSMDEARKKKTKQLRKQARQASTPSEE